MADEDAVSTSDSSSTIILMLNDSDNESTSRSVSRSASRSSVTRYSESDSYYNRRFHDYSSIEGSSQEDSWLSRAVRRLPRSIRTLIGPTLFLFILAAFVLDWSHFALFIITILVVKTELGEKLNSFKFRLDSLEYRRQRYSRYDDNWQTSNLPRRGTIEMDSDDESIVAMRDGYFEDPLSEDFEMDPAMVNEGQKIEWKGGDVPVYGIKILKAFAEGKEPKDESEIKYDPKQVPEELVDVDPLRFLQNPRDFNFCFLPKDVLVRICSMLPVAEFLNLSSTCRFLRWRMYAFCTCYISNPVVVKLRTRKIIKHKEYDIMPRDVYDTSKFENVKEFTALFAYVPPCLKKPFFCETLIVQMDFDKFQETNYTKALPVLLPLRCYARRVIVHQDARLVPREDNLDYLAANEFYKALNATTIRHWNDQGIGTLDIFRNCPFTKEMDMAWVDGENNLVDETPLNRIGYYCYCNADVVKNALNAFLYGEKNLEFHVYLKLNGARHNNRHAGFPVLEYLFNRYKDWQEYCSEKDLHLWYTTVEENGRRIKLRICKRFKGRNADVMIGKEKLFDRMEQHFNIYYFQSRHYYNDYSEWKSGKIWKVETAVEPDDVYQD